MDDLRLPKPATDSPESKSTEPSASTESESFFDSLELEFDAWLVSDGHATSSLPLAKAPSTHDLLTPKSQDRETKSVYGVCTPIPNVLCDTCPPRESDDSVAIDGSRIAGPSDDSQITLLANLALFPVSLLQASIRRIDARHHAMPQPHFLQRGEACYDAQSSASMEADRILELMEYQQEQWLNRAKHPLVESR